jgi:hypothetical protein
MECNKQSHSVATVLLFSENILFVSEQYLTWLLSYLGLISDMKQQQRLVYCLINYFREIRDTPGARRSGEKRDDKKINKYIKIPDSRARAKNKYQLFKKFIN